MQREDGVNMSEELIKDGGNPSISPDFNLPETEEWIQSLDEIVKSSWSIQSIS